MFSFVTTVLRIYLLFLLVIRVYSLLFSEILNPRYSYLTYKCMTKNN